MKLVARVLENFLAKTTPRKGKVRTEKLSAKRLLQGDPLGNDLGKEKDTSFGRELVGNHAPGIIHSTERIRLGILRRHLRRKNGLGTFFCQTLKHLNCERVPTLLKPHVTVNLQRLELVLPEFLDLCSGPAGSLGFFTGHIQETKSRVGALSV